MHEVLPSLATCSCRAVVLNLPNAVTLPQVVVTHNHKMISLLLHNSNFATVMNYNVNIGDRGFSKGVEILRLRNITLAYLDCRYPKIRGGGLTYHFLRMSVRKECTFLMLVASWNYSDLD